MSKIGIFFAPAKGSTATVANAIADKIGHNKADLILIDNDTEINKLDDYEKIIFGISTVGKDNWDNDYLEVGWDSFFQKLDKADISNKTIAIFGLGNHILYPNHFVDSMGHLGKKIIEMGGNLIGYCNKDGYEFTDSEAIINNEFIGLPIDMDNEEELTDQRIDNWLKSFKSQFNI